MGLEYTYMSLLYPSFVVTMSYSRSYRPKYNARRPIGPTYPVRNSLRVGRSGSSGQTTSVTVNFNIPVTAVVKSGTAVFDPGTVSYSLSPRGRGWWSEYAKLFNKFRIGSLSAQWCPSLASTASGQVAIQFDSDPIPMTGYSFSQVTSGKSSFGPITGGLNLRVASSQLSRLPWYYTSNTRGMGGSAITSSDYSNCAGIVYLCVTSGMTGGNPVETDTTISLGSLRMTMNLICSEPSGLTPLEMVRVSMWSTATSYATVAVTFPNGSVVAGRGDFAAVNLVMTALGVTFVTDGSAAESLSVLKEARNTGRLVDSNGAEVPFVGGTSTAPISLAGHGLENPVTFTYVPFAPSDQ